MKNIKKLLIAFLALTVVILPGCTISLRTEKIRIVTPASVFESGDDMYTVIWTTDKPGSGYITYTYNGTEYTANDQVGGNIRSLDTIHAVRVPKAHLDGNTYVYHSERVIKKEAYSAVKGVTVDSEPVKFKGYAGEEQINALVLSDIHGKPEKAKKAADNFTEAPSFLILNGDIVSHVVTKDEFIQILEYANLFSGGAIPVVYARGNHEPRGEYASEMLQYFRTSTGGLYYTFTYGPIWSVVLDAGEDKEDSHKEYNGLVDFRSYIAEETKWLENVTPEEDADIKLCISHKPELNDLDGSTWFDMLADMDIDALLSGHFHRLELHFYDGSQPYHRMITGGESEEYGFIATMLTFRGKTMHAKCYDMNGNIKADEDLAL